MKRISVGRKKKEFGEDEDWKIADGSKEPEVDEAFHVGGTPKWKFLYFSFK